MFSIFGSKGKKTRTQSSVEKLSAESQEMLESYQDNEDRYYTVRFLGEGGFGTVVCSFDNNLNRAVALKTLHDTYRDDQRQIRSIINEVRLISYLAHPGVVSIYDAFVSAEGDFTYTMELIQGEDLEELLISLEDKGELLPLPQGIKIFTKFCETLAFVHDKGVIHLDIKPSNIMLGQYGEVRILDWGTAHLFDPHRYEAYLREYGKDAKAEEIIHDRSDRIEGTIPFMSPEQTERPRNQLTPASDIFSTGIVMYRALTGRFPFSYENLDRFLYDLHQVEPPPLHEVRGDIPMRLSQICSKMLAKDINERYQSFQEVLRDLEDLSNSGQMFEQRVYEKGEVLIREGEAGDQAFQLIDGTVEISVIVDGKKQVLATRGSGSILGELSIFTREPRSATVTALETTTVKLLSQQMVVEELEKLNPWVGHMVYQLSQRFIEQNQRILKLEAERSKLLDKGEPEPDFSVPKTEPGMSIVLPENLGHTQEWGAFHVAATTPTPNPKTMLVLAKDAPKQMAFPTQDWTPAEGFANLTPEDLSSLSQEDPSQLAQEEEHRGSTQDQVAAQPTQPSQPSQPSLSPPPTEEDPPRWQKWGQDKEGKS